MAYGLWSLRANRASEGLWLVTLSGGQFTEDKSWQDSEMQSTFNKREGGIFGVMISHCWKTLKATQHGPWVRLWIALCEAISEDAA